MHLKEAIRSFLLLFAGSPHTYRSYEQTLTRLAEALGNARPVIRITAVDLLEFTAALDQSKLSKNTVYRHKKVIKRFFRWLHEEMEVIPENPARVIHQRRPSRYVRKDKAITEEELALILDYTKWDPLRHAIIRFLADTGCRAGGVATLTLDNLDIEKQMAEVTEKGDKTRPVWFGEECAVALDRWLKIRPEDQWWHNYVFCHRHGPYTPNSISRVVRRACAAVGIRSLGSHSLRHRKGHQMADNRIPPSVAATALGHEDVGTTLRHYYPADYDRAEAVIRSLAGDETKPDEHLNGRILRFKRT